MRESKLHEAPSSSFSLLSAHGHSGSASAPFRETLFRHLDGLAIVPVMASLSRAGLLRFLLAKPEHGLDELTREFHANAGYLNVALRMLRSQGWLTLKGSEHRPGGRLGVTERGKAAIAFSGAYLSAERFMPTAARKTAFLNGRVASDMPSRLHLAVAEHLLDFGLSDPSGPIESEVRNQILRHIEGFLIGPILVSMGVNGLLPELSERDTLLEGGFSCRQERISDVLHFFKRLGWCHAETGVLTATGKFHVRHAGSYGVPVSYLPTFAALDELLFGDPGALERDLDGGENHVWRIANIWGSGRVHTQYFRKVEPLLLEIFNQPVENQPKGILDLGCGDGTLLRDFHELISERTLRGRLLHEFPLKVIGIDYNDAAVVSTRKTLENAGIRSIVLRGDVGDPEAIETELSQVYGISMAELLHFRAFVDHNRRLRQAAPGSSEPASLFTGPYCFKGNLVPDAIVEKDLEGHFRRWAHYIRRYGLIVIELHTLDPLQAASRIGRVAVTSYDATHGFSDQYPVEWKVFKEAAHKAGLAIQPGTQTLIPDRDAPIISIQLLK